MNFWKNDGLNLDVTSVSGTMMALQQVGGNQVHFSGGGIEGVLQAKARGLPIVAVYAYGLPIYETVALSDSGITSYKDLKGKTIGIPDMSQGSYPFARSALKSAGLDPDKDVKWLAIGLGASAVNALRNKEIDAWAVWDTGVAALENRGFKFVNIDPPWINDTIGSVIFVHEDMAKNRPEEVTKFLRGLAKATVFALTNPEASVRNHWQMYPGTKPDVVNAETMAASLNIFQSRVKKLRRLGDLKYGEIGEKQWERTVQGLIENKLLPADFNHKAAYTNRFIAGANDFKEADVIEAAKQSKW